MKVVPLPELLPCPFCGGVASYRKLWSLIVDAMVQGHPHNADLSALGLAEGRVGCDVCGARSETGTHAEAVRLWNRRCGEG